MSKKKRLETILELIDQYEIDTQEQLTDLLINKGFDVSQATVSRDINELKLIKGAGYEKKFKYIKADVAVNKLPVNMLNLFKQVVLSINFANNLVVIKTLAGNGGTAGMVVDQMHFNQVLGSVAGDDTLLVIAKTNTDAETVVKSLRSL